MNHQEGLFCERETFTLHDCMPVQERKTVTEEILSGLAAERKHISCIYFYDEVGSKLFERITHLPEYYLTRIEKTLLGEAALEIGDTLGNADIVEFGSGDCSKISILLHRVPARDMSSIRYIPMDVSRTAVEEAAGTLTALFPELEIYGIIADFTKQLACIPEGARRLICFLGSTIGNFSRRRSGAFLRNLGAIMQGGDMLLIGFDMVKRKDILEKAYNDDARVTEAFNKNILRVVNRIAGTNFDPDAFAHTAFYNEEHSRIEMHLRALEDREIRSPHLAHAVVVREGETIHTENSHKYTERDIHEMVSTAGLEIQRRFVDENAWYSLMLLRKK